MRPHRSFSRGCPNGSVLCVRPRVRLLYSLAEPAIQLVPVLAHLGAWGRRHLPVSRELSVRAELLERGGQEFWDRFMDELREQHLGIPRRPGTPSAFAELTEAYEAELRTVSAARG
jgi:hypothetical protein